jgi:hypothetical protein
MRTIARLLPALFLLALAGCPSGPDNAQTPQPSPQPTEPAPTPTEPTPTEPTPPTDPTQQPPTSLPAQSEPCPSGACAAGLACVEYYGIAGPRGPKFTSCEVTCKGKGPCPAGQKCVTIADGPGEVCRPDAAAP